MTGPAPRPDGKQALFSTAVRRPGTVVVECSSCRGRTRIGILDLARAAWPVSLWLPWRRPSRWLRCPACRRRRWVTVRWTA